MVCITNLREFIEARKNGIIHGPFGFSPTITDRELRLWFSLWRFHETPVHLAFYMGTMIASNNTEAKTTIISGGEFSEPVKSYVIYEFLHSSNFTDVNFVYWYNLPILNDLLDFYTDAKIYVSPLFLKDPKAKKDVEILEKKGDIQITKTISGTVLHFPEENHLPGNIKRPDYDMKNAKLISRKTFTPLFLNTVWYTV